MSKAVESQDNLRKSLVLFGLLLVVYVVAVLLKGDQVWDLRVYLDGVEAWKRGLNPYLAESFPGRQSTYPYAYPPLTFFFFLPFSWISYSAAVYVWLGIKFLILSFLIFLWNKHFVRLSWKDPLVIFIFLFGFNATIARDLTSGNFSMVEQLGVWLSFVCLLKKRFIWFAAILVVTAQFRLLPIALLGVLLFVGQWRVLVGGLVSFAALLGLNHLLLPIPASQHIQGMLAVQKEIGVGNPSVYSLIRQWIQRMTYWNHPVHLPDNAPEIIYLIVFAVLVVFTLRALFRYSKNSKNPDLKLMIFFLCVSYGVMLPRFKAYSFILVLIPTLYLLRKQPKLLSYSLILPLLLFQNKVSVLPVPMKDIFFLSYEYLSWVCLFVVWCVYQVHMKSLIPRKKL